MKERALVLFTLCSQMAVGAFLTLGALHAWAAGRAGSPAADALAGKVLVGIGAVMALALFASLFHLGSPWKAYRAVANLRRSWLSREILASLLFAGLGTIFALSLWLGAGPTGLRGLLAWSTALIGLLLVYCMGRVYMQPTIPGWNRPFTLAAFFSTTFLLGGLGLAAGLVFVSPGVFGGFLRSGLGWTAWMYPVFILGQAAALVFTGRKQKAPGPDDLRPRSLPGYPMRQAARLRLGLLLAGALVLGLLLVMQQAVVLAWPVFALSLAAEALGRYEFYFKPY